MRIKQVVATIHASIFCFASVVHLCVVFWGRYCFSANCWLTEQTNHVQKQIEAQNNGRSVRTQQNMFHWYFWQNEQFSGGNQKERQHQRALNIRVNISSMHIFSLIDSIFFCVYKQQPQQMAWHLHAHQQYILYRHSSIEI